MLELQYIAYYSKQTLTESIIIKALIGAFLLTQQAFLTDNIKILLSTAFIGWLCTMVLGTWAGAKTEGFCPHKFMIGFNRVVGYVVIIFMGRCIDLGAHTNMWQNIMYIIVIIDECRSILKHSRTLRMAVIPTAYNITSIIGKTFLKSWLSKFGIGETAEEVIHEIEKANKEE